MRYSFRKRGNKRLVRGYIAILVLATLAILPLVLIPGIFAVALSMICGYLAFQTGRFLLNHTRSYILTHDEGLTFDFPGTGNERLQWEQVSHAGTILTTKGTTVRFVYSEELDRLATVPDEFEALEQLDAELKEHSPWFELKQKEGESVAKTILPLTIHAADNSKETEETENE